MKLVGSNELTELDEILLAILDIDILDALRLLCESSADWWLIAHLIDLLLKCGCKLLTVGDDDKSQIAEYLLLEYGSSLMSNQRYLTVSSYLIIGITVFECLASWR
jgi:hypothetical protein